MSPSLIKSVATAKYTIQAPTVPLPGRCRNDPQIFAIRTDIPGSAPKFTGEGEDIIDEALTFFRAQVFFKNYEPKGPADKTLIYLTCFIQKCLETIAKK